MPARKTKNLHSDIRYSELSKKQLESFIAAYDYVPGIREWVAKKVEEEKFGADCPTKVHFDGWLYAESNGREYPKSTAKSGKWCVFVKYTDLDIWFQKIRTALYEGLLGDQMKSSTAGSKVGANGVIIVYTYDYSDVEDVMRVRAALRDIGVDWKIAYKTDAATREGRYTRKGDKQIGEYFE